MEREYWEIVASRYISNDKDIKAKRGNILSDNGELLASSLPTFRIYMDFMSGAKDADLRKKDQAEKDERLRQNINQLSKELHKILPDKSEYYFKSKLRRGRKLRSRHYLIYPYRISYTKYNQIRDLPIFRLPAYKGGFHVVEYNQRKKPFGSLASRTIGNVYADPTKGAIYGIELAFNKLLKGEAGVSHKEKVMNKYLNIIDKEPVDGCDIITTINVNMQDICEKALVDQLHHINGDVGVVVLMEVKTGDVKAIVNMSKSSDGIYRENKNHAISDLLEPGSTFKTASLLAALDDEKVTPDDIVDTGEGIMQIYDRKMRDYNWYRGGFGEITLRRAFSVSSNIGISYFINKIYGSNPQKFIDKLEGFGLRDKLNIEIPGEGVPYIKGPKERYFAKTTLPWMSIGYETQIPPLNLLTFYNTIANNGTMVKPRFVKEAIRDGVVVEEYPTKILREDVCSQKALDTIKDLLKDVVKNGTGKPARSEHFEICGKTGTAQIAKGNLGYKNGGTQYLASFCGFFPAENPKYSMIVSIRKNSGSAAGGSMAGSVFKEISEKIYAKEVTYPLASAIDTIHTLIPSGYKGDVDELKEVLDELDINFDIEKEKNKQNKWVESSTTKDKIILKPQTIIPNLVPYVVGMGAKDAIFLLESKGLRVRISGTGKVKRQSIMSGKRIVKGSTIYLTLDN